MFFNFWLLGFSSIGFSLIEFSLIEQIKSSALFDVDTYSKALQLILIVVLNFFVYKVIKLFIKKVVLGYTKRTASKKGDTIATIVISVTKYVIYFVGFCQIMSVFNVSVTSILAVAGVSGIAIGFGAQSLVKDIIAGIFILMEEQFVVGDYVTIEGKTGTVEAVGIRITRLRSFEGDVHIVPNGEIKMVTNMSKKFKRAIVDVLVSYEDDVDKVIEILRDEMTLANKNIETLLSEPTVLGVAELNESTVKIRILAETQVGESWACEREIRRLVKNRFEKEGIKYPYKRVVVESE